MTRLLLLALLTANCSLGCISPRVSDMVLLRPPVKSITISAKGHLDDGQVHITDPEEIDQFLTMIRKMHGPWFMQVNFDGSRCKFIRFRMFRGEDFTDATMTNGVMAVPDIDHALYYQSHKDTQAELWSLALERLAEENAKSMRSSIAPGVAQDRGPPRLRLTPAALDSNEPRW